MGSTAITLFILCSLSAVASAAFNSTPEYLNCGGRVHPLSEYQQGVDTVVRNLIARTPWERYNFYNKFEKGETEVYGHGICNGLLSRQECMDCLRTVNAYRTHYCPFVVTAQAVLVDCEISYHYKRFHHGGPPH